MNRKVCQVLIRPHHKTVVEDFRTVIAGFRTRIFISFFSVLISSVCSGKIPFLVRSAYTNAVSIIHQNNQIMNIMKRKRKHKTKSRLAALCAKYLSEKQAPYEFQFLSTNLPYSALQRIFAYPFA